MDFLILECTTELECLQYIGTTTTWMFSVLIVWYFVWIIRWATRSWPR